MTFIADKLDLSSGHRVVINTICEAPRQGDGVFRLHQHLDSQAAISLIRARAASVRCLANGADRRQWAFDQANDLVEFDAVHPGDRESSRRIFRVCLLRIPGFELGENLF